MVKPEPNPILPRLIFAAVVGGCVWMVLHSILSGSGLSGFLAAQQLAPYVAALSTGDVAKARAAFDREVKGNPANPDTYLLIAQACARQQKYDLAVEYLNRGVAACKNSPAAERSLLYSTLAMCYGHVETSKPHKLAIEAARSALELDPENPVLLNGYGYILADNDEQIGEAELKIAHALDLLKKQQDSSDLTAMVEDSYGWVLYKQHKYEAAASALNQAIDDFPREGVGTAADRKESLGMLYYHLGAAYRAQKNLDRARTALQTAVQFAPDLKEATAEFAALKADLAAAPKAQQGDGKPGSVQGTGTGAAKPMPGATVNPAPVAGTTPIGKVVNASGSSKGDTSAVKPAPLAGKPSANSSTHPGPEKRP